MKNAKIRKVPGSLVERFRLRASVFRQCGMAAPVLLCEMPVTMFGECRGGIIYVASRLSGTDEFERTVRHECLHLSASRLLRSLPEKRRSTLLGRGLEICRRDEPELHEGYSEFHRARRKSPGATAALVFEEYMVRIAAREIAAPDDPEIRNLADEIAALEFGPASLWPLQAFFESLFRIPIHAVYRVIGKITGRRPPPPGFVRG